MRLFLRSGSLSTGLPSFDHILLHYPSLLFGVRLGGRESGRSKKFSDLNLKSFF